MPQNPFLLAADNSEALLPLLVENPGLAREQDEHGYSLVHAAASYGHVDLLTLLVRQFNVPVDLVDEDGETALFVAETVSVARRLVEELRASVTIRNNEGMTAREKIESEDEFPQVADYLKRHEAAHGGGGGGGSGSGPSGSPAIGPSTNGASEVNGHTNGTGATTTPPGLPPPPAGLSVTVSTMPETPRPGGPPAPLELSRRVIEIAMAQDVSSPAGMAELERLIEEAVASHQLSEARNVRPREDNEGEE